MTWWWEAYVWIGFVFAGREVIHVRRCAGCQENPSWVLGLSALLCVPLWPWELAGMLAGGTRDHDD